MENEQFIELLLDRLDKKQMIIQQLQHEVMIRDRNIELCEEEIEKLKTQD